MDSLELLRAEHDRVGESLLRHYEWLQRAIGLAIAIMGLAAAFTDIRLAVTLIPILVGLVAVYGMDLLREVMMLHGYKQGLEQAINEKVGARLLQHDSWIAPGFAVHSKAKLVLWSCFALVLLGNGIASLTSAITYDGSYDTLIKVGVASYWILWLISMCLGGAEAWALPARVRGWMCEQPTDYVWSQIAFDRWMKVERRRVYRRLAVITNRAHNLLDE